MENLTISDPPPPGLPLQHGGPGGMPPVLGRPPPPPQQLPAQMFTTAAQLLDLTDSKQPTFFHIYCPPKDTNVD
jgi:U6 snRNA-associated Sm-like protein LSm1